METPNISAYSYYNEMGIATTFISKLERMVADC